MEQTRKIVGNWLTRPLDPNAFFMAVISVLLLALASLLFWNDLGHAASWMTAIPQKVFQSHESWRLATALFAHADPAHLLSNSLLFFIFAVILYGHFGVVMFPVAALIFGGLTNLIVLKTMPPEAQLLGASGVVYWMGAVWLTLYFCLETRERFARRALKAVGIALMLFVPETFHQEVSYLSHVVGFIFGVLWGFVYYYWNRQQFLATEVVELIDEGDDWLISDDELGIENKVEKKNLSF